MMKIGWSNPGRPRRSQNPGAAPLPADVPGGSPDLQGGKVRQEVVPDEEAHEDPVVDAPLKVEGKRQAGHGQLSGQVLAATWRQAGIEQTGLIQSL